MPPARRTGVLAPAADAALVGAVRSGDEAAFEAFYRRYEGPVYRAVLALVREESLAEELVVDTFVRAYGARRRLDPDRAPLPWLRRIAINRALSARRRHPGCVPLAEPDQAPAPELAGTSPTLAAEQHETSAALSRAIRRLPAPMRVVVVLRYVEELPLAEIAATLDCPLGTVKSRLHAALPRLRADLRAASPALVDQPAGASAVPAR